MKSETNHRTGQGSGREAGQAGRVRVEAVEAKGALTPALSRPERERVEALSVAWPWAAVVFAAGLLLSGCTYLSYTGPNGERFTRSALGANSTVASLNVEGDTNGLRRVELRGYQGETAQALGTITEAAVRGAVQGAK